MSGQTEQLKQKLEEMLASNDKEWVNVLQVTLNAMYKQFQSEQQHGKQIIPLGTRRKSQPQIALSCRLRSQGGFGLSVTLVFVLLTF
ncbi:MAG TPA: hypothetical protein VER98_15025 [Terriglobia bacterium]|nr:hypothetical protein [Terriglobia bacterium]